MEGEQEAERQHEPAPDYKLLRPTVLQVAPSSLVRAIERWCYNDTGSQQILQGTGLHLGGRYVRTGEHVALRNPEMGIIIGTILAGKRIWLSTIALIICISNVVYDFQQNTFAQLQEWHYKSKHKPDATIVLHKANRRIHPLGHSGHQLLGRVMLIKHPSSAKRCLLNHRVRAPSTNFFLQAPELLQKIYPQVE